jgi:predicted GNAT family acetyltransferase
MIRLLIQDDRELRYCYTAYLDGRVAGRASWILVHEDTVLLPHVEVPEDLHDLGIGSLLVRRAVEDARTEGNTVLALCPYVRRWVDLHPASRDVVRKPGFGEVTAISALLAAERTRRKLHHDTTTLSPS